MRHQFTLEYWRNGDWYVGRLIEVPGVFSQGKTLDELNENIRDAYELMVTRERPAAPSTAQRTAGGIGGMIGSGPSPRASVMPTVLPSGPYRVYF